MTDPRDHLSAIRDERVRFSLSRFPGYDKGRNILWQAAWLFVLQAGFTRWWFPGPLRPAVLRAFGARVGRNVTIRDDVYLTWPWFLTVGDDVWIGRGVRMLTSTGITIGHDVCISQEAMLLSSGHVPTSDDFRVYDYPIRIGSHVWVCARAVVLHGVKVPDHTVVPANCVLTFGQRIPQRTP